MSARGSTWSGEVGSPCGAALASFSKASASLFALSRISSALVSTCVRVGVWGRVGVRVGGRVRVRVRVRLRA